MQKHNGFSEKNETNILLKFVPIMLIQFGLGWLGSLIVICYRKEKLKECGLIKNNFFKTFILSIAVCITSMIFLLYNNEIYSYLPLKNCALTKIFLNSIFLISLLGYTYTALGWCFAVEFNYVVISKK